MNRRLRSALLRVRWRIFAFVFGFGILAYLQQKSVTVAALQMMPQFGLSQMQIGWLQQAFLVGYVLLQLPGGLLGQRYGVRRAFLITGLVSLVAMLAMPLAPYVFVGEALFIVLLAAQFTLGLAQAPIYPVGNGVFQTWFPATRWAFVVGIDGMSTQLGAALTPPLIASLMSVVGWQYALLSLAVPAICLIAGWAWYGRDTPREHPSVTRAELAEIGDGQAAEVNSDISLKRLLDLLTNRNVLLLTFSYLLMNYVFYLVGNWCFLYLVQVRHFSVLESGFLAFAPPFVSAIGAGAGGMLTGALSSRYGARWGFRLVPLLALPMAGLLLIMAVSVHNPYLAVVSLSLSFGFNELTETSFWAGAMNIGRGDAMAVCGVLNTGGNLGGIIGIPVIAYLSGHGMWSAAFFTGTGFAIASALAWLGIDVGQPVSADETRGAVLSHT